MSCCLWSLPVLLRRLLNTALLLLVAIFITGCEQSAPDRFDPLPPDAVVLVIGDSLVDGTGARQGEGWPERLAQATGWKVINAGAPDDTSADARRRLPELLDMHAPQAVIIAVGGNDFLRNLPADDTRANLNAMVRRARSVTQHVALMAIPEKSTGAILLGNLSDHALYAELAEEHKLPLIRGVVSDVLSDTRLRADRIHANARGYARIAQGVEDALRAYGWTP
ncbi:GDSL-type esterase/lipase family protein [Pseudazoarcus pumilus]|uniref:Arylesterase n=1 Tax=Pseudazoarcus pumilus TaxID=2067960 RepID=A0A2I6S6R4_9RHOO|nr:GDSL-type esterase/lipase family protein [Pseudazoarcus pumilus]AUN94921.1 arylesterase [Pseudazoarcus pumilus]